MGQDRGLALNQELVTFQEPTDLLREGDSLHLAKRVGGRSRRRDKGRVPARTAGAASCTPGTCTSAVAWGGGEALGGAAGRALRKRRAQPAAGARDPGRRCTGATEVARKVNGVAL